MGLGLNLTGVLAEPAQLETWFNGVWDWLKANYPERATSATLGQGPGDQFPCVRVRFHPAAEPVKLWLSHESILNVLAETISAGPGYHLFLCDLLSAMGEKFGIMWEPETDEEELRDKLNPAFYSGERDQAYKEMFLCLGGMLAGMRTIPNYDKKKFFINMSPTYQFVSEMPLMTPMGPRDNAWIDKVIKKPSEGADVFAWFNPETGAEFLRNKAISQMWCDVRWGPPLTEEDESVMATVLLDLKKAYELDPFLDYPWVEWNELLGYLEANDEMSVIVAKNAKNALGGPLIGYRRLEVRTRLDQGWSILVPGSMAEAQAFDDSSVNHTWQFFNDVFTIWFTTYPTLGDAKGNIMPVAEAINELDELQSNMGELIEEDRKGKVWRRTFKSGDPKKSSNFRYSAIFLVPGRVAMAHFYTSKEGDGEIAKRFFRTVDNSAGDSAGYVEQPKAPRPDLSFCDAG